MYDLIIRNGTIIDGSGNPRYLGDVAVKDGRIEKLGTADNPTIAASANSEIDAKGKLITPGWVGNSPTGVSTGSIPWCAKGAQDGVGASRDWAKSLARSCASAVACLAASFRSVM